MSTPSAPDEETGEDQDRIDRLVSSSRRAQEQLKLAEQQIQKSLESEDTNRIFSWLQARFRGLKRIQLESLSNRVRHIFSILTRALSSLIVLFLIIGSFRGLFYNKVIFQDFTVPQEYAESAITGEVVKNKIIFKANRLFEGLAEKNLPRDSSDTEGAKRDNPLQRNVPREDIEIMGISLNALKGAIRGTLGLENDNVSGILIQEGGKLTLELSVTREEMVENKTFTSVGCDSVSLDCLEPLVERAAIYLLGFREPLLAAFHQFDRKAFGEAESHLQRAFAQKSVDEIEAEYREVYARACHVWGEILRRRAMNWRDSLAGGNEPNPKQKILFTKKFIEPLAMAKEKYRQALRLDDDYARARLSLANVLVETDLDEMEKFLVSGKEDVRSTITKIPTWCDSLNQAVTYYEATGLKQDSTFGQPIDRLRYGIAHYYLGEICHASGNTQEARKIFSWVESLDKTSRVYDRYVYWQKKAAPVTDAVVDTTAILALFRSMLDADLSEQGISEARAETLKGPFVEVLAATRAAYEKEEIDFEAYTQTLSLLGYFYYVDWLYESRIWFKARSETLLYNFPAGTNDSLPVAWSACSLTPDPKIIGRPLSIETEDFWYYLLHTYYDDESEDNVYQPDLAANYPPPVGAEFAATPNDRYQELNNWSWEEGQEWSYQEWHAYRRSDDFVASIGYNDYLQVRARESRPDSLSYGAYRAAYQKYVREVLDGREEPSTDEFRFDEKIEKYFPVTGNPSPTSR